MSKEIDASGGVREKAGGEIDVGIVLGSGLSDAINARFEGVAIPYQELEGAPRSPLPGHPGVAHVGTWAGRRVVVFAGRAHLYQGHTPHEVTYFVRLAAAAGARILVLTNAAGGLNPEFAPGDLMLISDHLNLTGTSAIATDDAQPFLNMLDAYSPRLRAIARRQTADSPGQRSDSPGPAPLRGRPLREGIYAGMRGPAYETLAEAAMLRRLGADAVGMSTVLETMAGRKLGLEVLGISLISNVIGPGHVPSHDAVLEASKAGAERLALLIETVLREL